MKKSFILALAAICAAAISVGCDAFKTMSKLKGSQGKPYEMILVCDQPQWIGPVGDSLRAVFTAPVPYLNQDEPLFDVMRVLPRGFTGMIADHRNVLKVLVDPSVQKAEAAVEYDVTAQPQIVVTLQAPTDSAMIAYVDQNRESLVLAFEQAERDRAILANRTYDNPGIEKAIKEHFGVEMKVPKGYLLADNQSDFLWARFEYPTASQGFFVYAYPYEGPESLTPEALIAARNKFAARIPGPSDGSYMITSDAFEPAYRVFRLEGRLWCELRGFWDVHGDFMGGPFVSYTTVDTQTNRVFTLDCYVYAPDLNRPRKRNYLRGLEHLLYTVKFPGDGNDAAADQGAVSDSRP